MSDDISFSAAEMITAAIGNIEKARLEESNKILNSWRLSLEKIYSKRDGKIIQTGKNMYAHSRPIDLRDGVLLVEADHPGWIQLLHTYQNFILDGLKKNIPELEINSLVFRLKGSDFGLTTVDYDEQIEIEKKRLEEKFAKEDEILKKFETPKSEEKSEVPDALKKIFEDMSKSLLTKNR